jgi:hypothetical protein
MRPAAPTIVNFGFISGSFPVVRCDAGVLSPVK